MNEPKKESALDRQRRLVATLPQTREQAEELQRGLTLGMAPRVKCDGNHGGPRCADPECWNDSPPAGVAIPQPGQERKHG